jgi:single-strand DNA-binding protein
MSGVNKVILVGRLGADPEVKQVRDSQMAQLSLATSEKYTTKDGQKQEKTEWHRIVVWGKQAEVIGKYATKGSMLFVEGKLQTRSWEDQQGQKRYTTEVQCSGFQFLSSNKEGGGGQSNNSRSNVDHDFGNSPNFSADEEIPF